MQISLGKTLLQCRQGTIIEQPDVDAVVTSSTSQLGPSGSLSAVIHASAGIHMETACRQLTPLNPGESVVTGAFDLPNDFIIHCLVPARRHDSRNDQVLATCYSNVLLAADQKGIRSVAVPVLFTEEDGYIFEVAAEIVAETVAKECSKLHHLRLVRFVFDDAISMNSFPGFLIRAVAKVEQQPLAC